MANPSKSVISGFTMEMGLFKNWASLKLSSCPGFDLFRFFGPTQALQDFRDGVASILVATAAIEEGTVGGTWGGWLRVHQKIG